MGDLADARILGGAMPRKWTPLRNPPEPFFIWVSDAHRTIARGPAVFKRAGAGPYALALFFWAGAPSCRHKRRRTVSAADARLSRALLTLTSALLVLVAVYCLPLVASINVAR
jgi:hypothetical protein